MNSIPMVRITFLTHNGRVWRKNQDAVLIGERIYQKPFASPATLHLPAHQLLLAVADGVAMGPCPATASKRALRLLSRTAEELGYVNARAIRSVQAQLAESARSGRCKGMATTLAGLWVGTDRMTIFNVGDSRVYRWRDGSLSPSLTFRPSASPI